MSGVYFSGGIVFPFSKVNDIAKRYLSDLCPSQAAGLVFLPAATGTGGVAGDFRRQANDVIWFGGLPDESIVSLKHGEPFLI